MKILFCSEKYAPSVGGVQEVTRQLAERFALRGHDVYVATSHHNKSEQYELLNGVKVRRFNVFGNFARGMSGQISQYINFIQSEKFDRILVNAAQQWTLDALIDAVELSNVYLIPCGFSQLLNSSYDQYFVRLAECMPKMAGLFFCSENYQDIEFARRHGAQRIHIVPNGADELEFEASEVADLRPQLLIGGDEIVILTVGTRIAAKGHWEVLRSYGMAKFPGKTTLLINANIPSTSWIQKCRNIIKHLLGGRLPLSIESKVRVRGPNKRVIIVDLDRPDLIRAYKGSDFFILASHREYSPLVLFEARAAGLPFVSTPAGNASEIAAESSAGLIVPSSKKRNGDVIADVSECASLLESLTNNKEMREQMKLSARTMFNKRYTWDTISEQYETILTSSLN